ncbi:MAG TPA: hypothetical protein VHV30_01535, partial [Polyangiaceae bacterium]|nr:hypothetical protein [Polyangiaceae bacterium]
MGSNVGNAGRWRSRARLGAVSAVTALVAGLVVAMTARVWTRPSDADTKKRVLSAAPADAWLVLSADVAAAWPLLEPIVGTDAGVAGASRIAGLGTVSAACGFEPLEHVRQLLVALPEHPPEGGDHGDFGLAFDGDFTSESLEACARKAILAGGATPDVTTRADYTRIAGGPRGASLAVRPGGPYLVGRGAWLDAMIDAVDGKGTPTEASGAHEALRRDLLDKAATEPGLVITALLPKALRDRLAGESEEGAGASAVADAGVGAGAG